MGEGCVRPMGSVLQWSRGDMDIVDTDAHGTLGGCSLKRQQYAREGGVVSQFLDEDFDPSNIHSCALG